MNIINLNNQWKIKCIKIKFIKLKVNKHMSHFKTCKFLFKLGYEYKNDDVMTWYILARDYL